MRFEKVYGKPPGDQPTSYWQPWLGDHCGVTPAHVADLSPRQLMACYEYATKDD